MSISFASLGLLVYLASVAVEHLVPELAAKVPSYGKIQGVVAAATAVCIGLSK